MQLNTINSLESSYKLFSTLQTKNFNSIEKPPKIAQNTDFDSNFPGMFIDKPIYTHCNFVGSIFERPAGELSQFISCGLYDCKIINADFRYCNFEHTLFESKDNVCSISNSNLSYGTLINTNFIRVCIEGTPFKEMLIDSCLFENCEVNSFGFERTTIMNCQFNNIDMSKIVFRFCDFDNVKFKNVVIHILDLAKNYGLINELKKNGCDIKIFYGQNNYMSLDAALKLLPNLLLYYFNEKEYYYVINILMLEERYEELWSVLSEAFEYEILCNDFATLQDLCSLVVKLNVFDQDELKQLYNLITLKSSPNKMPRHQLKSYVSYLENIKNILLENPNNLPTAHINILTNIKPGEIKKVAPLLSAIEHNISKTYPSINPRIQISHHSPYDIEVIISALLPELLTVCQLFYYGFGGVKALKDIISSRHEKFNKKDIHKRLKTDTKKESKKIESKKVSLKLGIFEFNYSSECEEIVESIEYLIT